ncbi:MAG: DNA methyltransferase, partial [Candidatus Brocadiia bacterium]
MVGRKSAACSEVETYDHIRSQLRKLGWRVKNPNLRTGGQVWTQNQCLDHPSIKKALGKTRPENIVKLTERYLWVIEGKAKRRDIDRAVNEALHVYSKRINDINSDVEAAIGSGVAGDEAAGYIVKTFILLKGTWQQVTINGQEATGLLTPSDVQFLLEQHTNNICEFQPPQWLFLQAAERINEVLHMGGINKNDRAKTMAALLLAVVEDAPNLETDLP